MVFIKMFQLGVNLCWEDFLVSVVLYEQPEALYFADQTTKTISSSWRNMDTMPSELIINNKNSTNVLISLMSHMSGSR